MADEQTGGVRGEGYVGTTLDEKPEAYIVAVVEQGRIVEVLARYEVDAANAGPDAVWKRDGVRREDEFAKRERTVLALAVRHDCDGREPRPVRLGRSARTRVRVRRLRRVPAGRVIEVMDEKALAARKIARKSVPLREVWRAAYKAERALVERDLMICAAADSHSYSEIATACGLSKPRVQQIVNAGR